MKRTVKRGMKPHYRWDATESVWMLCWPWSMIATPHGTIGLPLWIDPAWGDE